MSDPLTGQAPTIGAPSHAVPASRRRGTLLKVLLIVLGVMVGSVLALIGAVVIMRG